MYSMYVFRFSFSVLSNGGLLVSYKVKDSTFLQTFLKKSGGTFFTVNELLSGSCKVTGKRNHLSL